VIVDPVDYLLGLETLGIKFGLDNIRAITAGLGHPEACCPSVHIAGTNGKGSVAAMLDAALLAAGLRTGRYTSPHLVRLEERFAIAGRAVDPGDLRAAAADVRRLVEGLRAGGTLLAEPTFFEVTTAIAFELFRRARVELQVLEVGMGGRFDATNIVTPLAGAITTIDLDHEAFLGATIAEIAFEKAGIIKPGMPIVLGESRPDAVEVIATAARERRAAIVAAMDGVDLSVGFAQGRATIDLATPARRYGPMTLGLRGRHQVRNAVVAVRLAEMLETRGVPVGREAIERGLTGARWPGRLDLLEAGAGRRVLIDAAHNPGGAAVLSEYLAEVHPGGLPMVFGVMRDKNAGAMLAALLPRATHAVMTEPPTPRAMDASSLVRLAAGLGRTERIERVPAPAAALERAFAAGDTVLVAGSIFLAGALLPVIDPSFRV